PPSPILAWWGRIPATPRDHGDRLPLPIHPNPSQFGVGTIRFFNATTPYPLCTPNFTQAHPMSPNVQQWVANSPKTQNATETPLPTLLSTTARQSMLNPHLSFVRRRGHARTSSPAPVTALCDPLLKPSTCTKTY